MHTINFARPLALSVLLLPVTSQACVISSSSVIPPALPASGVIGYHFSGAVPTFNVPATATITIDSGILRTLVPVNVVPSGANENASFSANLDAIGDVIPLANDLPSSSTGDGSMVTFGRVGNITGTFQTEMLFLNLNGTTALGGFQLRESPTLASLGQTSISSLGGGQFRIDSQFDIFLEISIDSGANWFPNVNGAARVTLGPEPGPVMLAGLTGCTL